MKRAAVVVVMGAVAILGVAAGPAAASYQDEVVAWNDCKTYEKYGPFWGRVLLCGRDPDRFPPCGPRPVDPSRAKNVGPAFSKGSK